MTIENQAAHEVPGAGMGAIAVLAADWCDLVKELWGFNVTAEVLSDCVEVRVKTESEGGPFLGAVRLNPRHSLINNAHMLTGALLPAHIEYVLNRAGLVDLPPPDSERCK
jgi:hypothetical protein